MICSLSGVASGVRAMTCVALKVSINLQSY